MRGFPGGSVVMNPPANAGDMGSIPGPRRSHKPQSTQASAPQQLSLCSRVRELPLLKPVSPKARALLQETPLQRQACAPQLPSSPPLNATEKSPHSNEDPLTANNNVLKFLKN